MTQITATTEFQFALAGFLLQAKQNLMNAAAELDLSSGQAFSLMLMDAHAVRSMKEYCLAYKCDSGNLTGLVDGLEEKGLVVREQDQVDRRIKVIRVLPAGAVLQQKLAAKVADFNKDLFSVLEPEEQDMLASCIQKLYKAGFQAT